MTQVCSQECGEVSVGQNPPVLIIPETNNISFSCTITSSCHFISYVKVNDTTLAWIPGNKTDENIKIVGERSSFIVNVKNPERRTYYCGAVITVKNISVKVLGCGTQIRSGSPIFGTKTGIMVSILCVCVGMINKLL